MKKNEFKLAGMQWKIVDTDMPDLGCSLPDTCTILLSSKLKGQEREVTLLHELSMLFFLQWVNVNMMSDS